MKTWHVIILIIALAATVPVFAGSDSDNKEAVPSTIRVLRPPSKVRWTKSEIATAQSAEAWVL